MDKRELPMNFEFEIEDLHFAIELEKSKDHRPDYKHSDWTQEDIDLWREGELTYFQMFITSTHPNGQSLTHYVPAILLPIDQEEELQERIEVFLNGPTGLDKILAHWDAEEADKPEWAE
ncbi:MAG: hypothetical protein CME63_17275 [Halobacteriovoraceae bacterium]|nr:hypothetical protein [Halobacteriovoraceae bacterium]MBC99499.1 hypothetical protein [Halobacteriovoraceae bacterium]|tara:strand:- start:212083 stop:212439 length:357 start_codon:yes stop_codon:yes gene_type:complete